jgi:hypothetical protein
MKKSLAKEQSCWLQLHHVGYRLHDNKFQKYLKYNPNIIYNISIAFRNTNINIMLQRLDDDRKQVVFKKPQQLL